MAPDFDPSVVFPGPSPPASLSRTLPLHRLRSGHRSKVRGASRIGPGFWAELNVDTDGRTLKKGEGRKEAVCRRSPVEAVLESILLKLKKKGLDSPSLNNQGFRRRK